MSRVWKVVLSVVVVVALAAGGFAVFEYFERHDKVENASRPCGDLLSPSASTTLPAGLAFAVPSGRTLLDVSSQGKTVIVTVLVKGDRDDLVDLRDEAVEDLKRQGYTARGTDQEPTYEAEGEFSGKAEGTINVQPLCEGYDKIRYKFNL
jgi:hypothetical protein